MPILRDISLFWSMAHVTVIFLMLFRSKYKQRKTVILTTACVAFLMIANAVGLATLGVEKMGRLLIFTCSIPSFVFFYILSRDKNLSYLFTFCLADTLCMWILSATNLLDFLLGGEKFIVMFVLRLIAFPLIEYIIWKRFRRIYGELQNVIKKGWGAYAGMTVLYYLLLIVMFEYPVSLNNRPEYIPAFVLVLVLMLFNYVIIFYSLYKQYELYEREKNESVLNEQKTSLETQLESQQYIRKLRHDMRGHIITLQGLLSGGKNSEAAEYLSELERHIDADNVQVCANPYINAQLSHYLQKFSELDTGLVCDIKIGNEDIPFTKVCSMLSNALQNALEESATLPKESRKVSVQMKYNKDYLIIRIKNRCHDGLNVEKGTIPKTNKKEKGHGLGLLSIKETAEGLGGDMVCYTENNYFILDVMLQIK